MIALIRSCPTCRPEIRSVLRTGTYGPVPDTGQRPAPAHAAIATRSRGIAPELRRHGPGCAPQRRHGAQGLGFVRIAAVLLALAFTPALAEHSAPDLRRQAMVEAAFARGAADAMAERAREIGAALDGSAADLDRIYRFDALMLHRAGFIIVPPVLVAMDRAMRVASDGTGGATARELLQIAAPARILSRVPDWRDWLIRSWPEPEPVHAALAPRNPVEQAAFDAASARGRGQGAALADAVHAEDLDRLNRDWLGMIEWRRRLAAGMVTEPELLREAVPVSGGGKRMRIAETFLEIAQPARLNPVMQHWSPIERKPGAGERQ